MVKKLDLDDLSSIKPAEEVTKSLRFPKEFFSELEKSNNLGASFSAYMRSSMLFTALKGGDELARSLTACTKEINTAMESFTVDIQRHGLLENGKLWVFFSKRACENYPDIPSWRMDYFILREIIPYAMRWHKDKESHQEILDELNG